MAVLLAERFQVPLIENDLNGDVYFGSQRPRSCKTFDESGIVLWCGSVSKTLAPGYRVGWTAPGRFLEKVLRMKLYHSISSTSITQEVIAKFLESGRYENHLRRLRHTLHSNLLKMSGAVAEYFPEGTLVSRPQGGYVLWLELPEGIDTVVLHPKAAARNLSYAPGRIFTMQQQYQHCMRLNFGLTWQPKLDAGLRLLGKLAKAEL